MQVRDSVMLGDHVAFCDHGGEDWEQGNTGWPGSLATWHQHLGSRPSAKQQPTTNPPRRLSGENRELVIFNNLIFELYTPTGD